MKSEFGGIVYLLIVSTTIALTIIFVFPNGFVINTLITDYSVATETGGMGVDVFGPSDYLMSLFFFDKSTNSLLKGNELMFLVRGVEAFQTFSDSMGNTTVGFKLDLAEDITNGRYYLYKTETNSGVQVYNDTTGSAKIRVEINLC